MVGGGNGAPLAPLAVVTEEGQRSDGGRDEYDSPWKGAIEHFTEPFMALLFPEIHRGIDWRCPPAFLDEELPSLYREARVPPGVVDRVLKVRRTSGEDAWVLIHVEVQAQRDPAFARRMFVYHYRLFDRHREAVVSIAVLADDRRTWRPGRYHHGLWGCELTLAFPTVKLLDLGARWAELEASDNPFAGVVMAHLKTQQTRRDSAERARWKLHLARWLFGQGYKRDDILEMYRFIDWVMALPKDLERLHRATLQREQEGQSMPHLTFWERRGMEKGLEQGKLEGSRGHARRAVVQALEVRFGSVPEAVVAAVNALDDLKRLDGLLRQAIIAASLDDFERAL